MILTIIAMFVTMVFFAIIMKRPTMRGRKLLDEILGFKDYLEVAEKDEMNLRNPPEKTPELFEAYLPFALALGVDQPWAEKFASVLAAVQQTDGTTYQPRWYNGSFNTMDLSRTTSQLSNSLNTAITSSVSPPRIVIRRRWRGLLRRRWRRRWWRRMVTRAAILCTRHRAGLLVGCVQCHRKRRIECLSNAAVYTVDADRSWAEAVAVRDGHVVFVGSNKDAQAWIGDETDVTDLDGQMLLPGFHDSHGHVLLGVQTDKNCDLLRIEPSRSCSKRRFAIARIWKALVRSVG